MGNVITNPMLWVGLAFIMMVSIIVGITVHKRRTKELEELNKMFSVPEQPPIAEEIPMERIERGKHKQEQLRTIAEEDRPMAGMEEETVNERKNRQEELDMGTSRRLYKKSLLSPMQVSESSLHETEIRGENQREPVELPLGSTRSEMNKRKEAECKELEEPLTLPSRSARKSKKKRI
jgi:hypothetical protein